MRQITAAAGTGIEIERVSSDMLMSGQAAALARCSGSELLKATIAGLLPFYTVRSRDTRQTTRRNRWYKRSDVRAWVDSGKPLKAPPARPGVPQQLALAPAQDPQLQRALDLLNELKGLLAPLAQAAADVAELRKALG
jgi:hypothetical protein